VEGEAKYIDDDTMFELNFHIKGMKAFTQELDEYKIFYDLITNLKTN